MPTPSSSTGRVAACKINSRVKPLHAATPEAHRRFRGPPASPCISHIFKRPMVLHFHAIADRHERSAQGNVGLARAISGHSRKAASQPAHQGIGGQLFAQCGSTHGQRTFRRETSKCGEIADAFWHKWLRKDKRESPMNTGFKASPGIAGQSVNSSAGALRDPCWWDWKRRPRGGVRGLHRPRL